MLRLKRIIVNKWRCQHA